MNNKKYHASQFLLRLTQTVTVETGRSLVCIPDRDTADYELSKLQHKHGANLIKATIRKDRPPKRAPSARATYTLRYFLRETQSQQLF